MTLDPTTSPSPEQIQHLQDQAVLVRKTMLDMFNGYGCLSGAFSAVELYVALCFDHLDAAQTASGGESRTRVLPKGTSALAFYATLNAAGIIDAEQLEHYGTDKLPYLMHVGVACSDATLYTLGPTLRTAVGMAVASKLKQTPYEVMCFMGDGELQEHVDQAAKCAAGWGLDNLTVVVDCNRQQSYYPIEYGDPTMIEGPSGQLDAVRMFWEACGWEVAEINGHDLASVLQAYRRGRTAKVPFLILARTVKGKGVPAIEGKHGFQHRISAQELQQARELYATRAKGIIPVARTVRAQGVQRGYPRLTIPGNESILASMGQTLSAWIQALKDANPGAVYSLDSDCPNIFEVSPEQVLAKGCYGASHLFPGLNERLTLTVAKGLAYEGLYPIVGARADNLCDVSEEWHAIGIDRLPVLLVGTRPGAILADWGPEKCSFCDIEILSRSGIQVLQPSNPRDLVWILERLYSDPASKLPAYLRVPDFTSRTDTPDDLGGQRWINGFDVCHGAGHSHDFTAFIASGDMLQEVLRMVEQDGDRHRIKVLDLFHLTRLNPAALQAALQGAKGIISVIEARSRSISESVFTSLTPAQRGIYQPLGIEHAPALHDNRPIKDHGFYAAREYVLQRSGLDATALAEYLKSRRS